jgi:signal transduction histidine kinase
VFSPNAPALLYYSHVPAAIIALLLSLFIIFKNRQALEAKILVAIALIYAAWAVANLFIWTQIDVRVVMYLWSFWFTAFTLIFVLSFYFLYAFIKKQDAPFGIKALFGALLLPIILLAFTPFDLSSFDVIGCNAVENPLMIGYAYLLTTIIFIAMVMFAFNEYYRAPKENKRQIALVSLGTLLFLISFSVATYIPSILNLFQSDVDTFSMEMYGFFGMTIFIGFLSYLIVRYKAFSIKVLAAQALVFALVALIASEFFFVRSVTNRMLTGVTLFLAVGFGFFLVRSVKREVAQREHIEKLAGELQETNERQEGLLHFIGHEVKGFLTKDSGAFAAIIDGDFGTPPDGMKPFAEEALASSRQGALSVENILKASNLKKGSVTYAKEAFDLKNVAELAVEKAKPVAEQKGLTLTFTAGDEGSPYVFTGDKAQIHDHVFRNLIDNAVNYTPTGSITVSLKKENGKFVFAVKDSGIGITDEDKQHLFTEGGHGKDSQRVNVHSTGYGLYIAKQITEAQGGTIRAESEGQGKGSTFTVEFPI